MIIFRLRTLQSERAIFAEDTEMLKDWPFGQSDRQEWPRVGGPGAVCGTNCERDYGGGRGGGG